MITGFILWVCSVVLILLLVWAFSAILPNGVWEDDDDDWY